jgi:hypothetical protein
MNDTSQIPTWWLVVSGIFFALNVLFLIALTIVMLALAKVIVAMKPKLTSLESSVQSLVEKVSSIASNVEDLSATVKTTIEKVGGSAQVVAGNAQLVSQTASREFEKFSPLVVGAIATIRVMTALNDFRLNRKAKAEGKSVKHDGKSGAKKKVGLILSIASHFLRR